MNRINLWSYFFGLLFPRPFAGTGVIEVIENHIHLRTRAWADGFFGETSECYSGRFLGVDKALQSDHIIEYDAEGDGYLSTAGHTAVARLFGADSKGKDLSFSTINRVSHSAEPPFSTWGESETHLALAFIAAGAGIRLEVKGTAPPSYIHLHLSLYDTTDNHELVGSSTSLGTFNLQDRHNYLLRFDTNTISDGDPDPETLRGFDFNASMSA
ncbi:hypothetical protein DJ030_07380 [bacterium endosymbiont of Escarpia laminata]|nr:MAG: hypothetical protein DJ030_07380 [bacterium endosymbiont of Escarpia laminata]RLJ21851.1 MAG: hypothetical protein DJ031_02270 [bacterium endosymbiont of Escarpia laminata]